MSPTLTDKIEPHNRAAAAGNENESRYHQLFELVSDALFLIDNETGQILEANEAAAQLYGYSPAELLTLRNVDLSAEPEQTRAVTQAQWTHKTIPVRFHRKRDGTVFPVEITGRQFLWQGRPVHLAAIRDISHRLHTEDELRAKTEQLMLILNGVPVLIAYVDAEERYRFVNQPYADWYGFTPEEMIGKKIREILRPEVYERAAPFYRAALSGQPVAFENVAYDKDGHQRVVNVRFTPHIDTNGHVVGFLGLIYDITERRQAEEIAQRTSEQFSTLYATGQELSRTLDPEEIYAVLHRFTRQTMDCDRFYVSTYDPQTRLLTCAAAWEGDQRLDVHRFLPLPADHAGQEFQMVIQSGQALLFSNEEIPLRAAWSIGSGTTDEEHSLPKSAGNNRSSLLVPLKTEGAVTGIIQVFSAQANAYTLDHLHLLESFSLHVASTLHNARLFAAGQVERERLTALYEITRRLALAVTREDVTTVIKYIGPYVGAETCELILFNTKPPFYFSTVPARAELSPTAILDYIEQITTKGLEAWVLAHQQTAVVLDTQTDPRWLIFPGHEERDPVRSVICVPLCNRRGDITGILSYNHSSPGAWGAEAQQLAEEIGARVAVALENTWLYEETRRRLEREERLNELAHALGGETELSALLNRFLPAVTALTGADCAAISLLAPDGFVYHDYYQYNLPTPVPPSRRPIGEGIVGQVIQQRATLQIDEYRDHPAALPAWVQAGVHSLLSVPLLVGNEAVGALGLFTVGEVRPFGPEAAASAEAAARLVAVAIQRARLFEQERKQRQLAEALAQAAAALSSSLELDKVLDQILEQTLQVVIGNACNVMLVQEQQARMARWRGYEALGTSSLIAKLVLPIATTPNLRQMAETGAPIVIPDVTTYPGWAPLPGTEWLHSYVGAPIKVGGLVVGFLNVDSNRPDQFTADDAQRLQAFANQAAAAIENAGLFQELRRYAEQLEQRVQERTAQLQSQVARAEAILSSVSDGIAVTDRDGTMLQANPVMQTWLTRLPPAEAERLISMMRDLAQRVTECPEATLELPGLDLQLRAAPIAAPGVAEVTAVIAAHDISELKALDRMKSRFVSNVSHELRTPITTIRLYATLLRRGHREKAEQYLTALEEETKRLAQLVEDVLQISRIDAGRLELKLRPTPLNSLVEAVVTSHATLATAGGLTLTYYPHSPSPWTVVDSEKIIQVFNNLTENAIRYTRPGGSVTVSTGVAVQQGGKWATITIVDTGIGIPPSELPHIFERFYRGDEPRHLQLPGSGLGLAIVKEIVELHSGHITVESAVGQGSAFTVWLPLTQPPGLP